MSETSKGTRSGAAHHGSSSSKSSSDKSEERKKGENYNSTWAHYAKEFEKIPTAEFDALMKSHCKNMEAIRQAQQTASELLQKLMNINSQYMRNSFDEFSAQIRMASEGIEESLSQKPSVANTFVKSSFDRALSHCKQVTDLFSQSTAKVFDCYRKRFDEGLSEAKAFVRS